MAVIEEKVTAVCPKCAARLKVRADRVGQSVRCPGCKEQILVAADVPPVPAKPGSFDTGQLPATEKQKSYATSLGCQFLEGVTRSQISLLIDSAKQRRYDEADALQNREQSAVDAVRRELLEDMSDDPQVSQATCRQMVDSLDEQGTAAVLITMPFDQIDSFQELTGVDVRVCSSSSMEQHDTADVLMRVARHLTPDSNRPDPITPRSLLTMALTDWRDNDSRTEHPDNIGLILGDSDCVLLAFDVISCSEVAVGVLSELPPKPVVRDFAAVAGLAMAKRPKVPRSIRETKQSPGPIVWAMRRYLIREFFDHEWLVCSLYEA